MTRQEFHNEYQIEHIESVFIIILKEKEYYENIMV